MDGVEPPQLRAVLSVGTSHGRPTAGSAPANWMVTVLAVGLASRVPVVHVLPILTRSPHVPPLKAVTSRSNVTVAVVELVRATLIIET